ncbi:MAG: hypothetical protein AAB327_09535 [Actinomycetota bacterium]
MVDPAPPSEVTVELLTARLYTGAEIDARERAWRFNDAIEGRSSFLAKRPPNFMGS